MKYQIDSQDSIKTYHVSKLISDREYEENRSTSRLNARSNYEDNSTIFNFLDRQTNSKSKNESSLKTLQRFTCDELRRELRDRDLPTSGTKDILVSRLSK